MERAIGEVLIKKVDEAWVDLLIHDGSDGDVELRPFDLDHTRTFGDSHYDGIVRLKEIRLKEVP